MSVKGDDVGATRPESQPRNLQPIFKGNPYDGDYPPVFSPSPATVSPVVRTSETRHDSAISLSQDISSKQRKVQVERDTRLPGRPRGHLQNKSEAAGTQQLPQPKFRETRSRPSVQQVGLQIQRGGFNLDKTPVGYPSGQNNLHKDRFSRWSSATHTDKADREFREYFDNARVDVINQLEGFDVEGLVRHHASHSKPFHERMAQEKAEKDQLGRESREQIEIMRDILDREISLWTAIAVRKGKTNKARRSLVVKLQQQRAKLEKVEATKGFSATIDNAVRIIQREQLVILGYGIERRTDLTKDEQLELGGLARGIAEIEQQQVEMAQKFTDKHAKTMKYLEEELTREFDPAAFAIMKEQEQDAEADKKRNDMLGNGFLQPKRSLYTAKDWDLASYSIYQRAPTRRHAVENPHCLQRSENHRHVG